MSVVSDKEVERSRVGEADYGHYCVMGKASLLHRYAAGRLVRDHYTWNGN